MKNIVKILDELVQILDLHFQQMESFTDENDAALMGIVVRDLTSLKVIRKFIEFNNTGSASMVLARTIVEGMITIKYMQLKGMDKMLKKFRVFEVAEAKQDVDYLLDKGLDVSSLDVEELNKRFEENKKEFIRSDGKLWHSWAHLSSDQMLEEILKSNTVDVDNIKTIISTYVQGSRKIHPSPSDIKLYMLGKKVMNTKDILDRRLALVSALSSILISATIFAQKRKEKKLESRLNALFKRLDVENVDQVK